VVGENLNKAMEFPDAKSSNPEGFYAGAINTDAKLTRPKEGWFKKQGYIMHKTTYTYGNRWDGAPMTAAFYAPNSLQSGDAAPIIWFFHGGSYVSKAPQSNA
jgi:acetyl esterase/lipase